MGSEEGKGVRGSGEGGLRRGREWGVRRERE